MDEMNAFERQVARDALRDAGPSRPVDPAGGGGTPPEHQDRRVPPPAHQAQTRARHQFAARPVRSELGEREIGDIPIFLFWLTC